MSDPILTRCSTRAYTTQDVTEEEIETILRAGMQAPSARNMQEWEIYVVRNKDIKSKLLDHPMAQAILAMAPVVFVPCYIKEVEFPMFHDIDLSACTTNMLNEIEELGLGGVWMGVSPLEERINAVRKALDIPDSLVPFALVPCGHKAEDKVAVSRYTTDKVHKVY